jgi:hypothetical protein
VIPLDVSHEAVESRREHTGCCLVRPSCVAWHHPFLDLFHLFLDRTLYVICCLGVRVRGREVEVVVVMCLMKNGKSGKIWVDYIGN